jgi:Cytochrome C oxidase, cbb3-type, subunit III
MHERLSRFPQPGRYFPRPKGKNCVYLIILLGTIVFASTLQGQKGTGDISVTAVTGESWIRHLHKSFGDTSMGRTWNLGPAPADPAKDVTSWQLDLPASFPAPVITLHGSDLYRMTCQGCHKESGQGAPPEINSVIDPVRATSVAVTTARMKASGREMSPAEIAAMAKEFTKRKCPLGRISP